MNREIKFRGYDKFEKKWVYGYGLHQSIFIDGSSNAYVTAGIREVFIVDKESVGQYTGLKDKNGVEIYEGDIVRRPAFVDKDCYCKVSKLFGYIEMNSYAWCVVNKYKNKKYLSPLFIEEEVGELENIEVIGNIYENKNLLEGE
jgi:uncharacterized phage protein (TIGR01671 family)